MCQSIKCCKQAFEIFCLCELSKLWPNRVIQQETFKKALT